MVKCEKCGTAWTTLGMTLCPICGAGVGDPESAKKTEVLSVVGAAPNSNGTSMAPATRSIEPAVGSAAPPVKDIPLKVSVFPSGKDSSVEDSAPAFAPVVDASALMALHPSPEAKTLPAPARPLNGPLILGAFALVTSVLLPLTVLFESHRILGILGFCMSGFFVPFAPVAWIAGLSAEKRRREQGLAPERRVVIGRLLGQWGTLLLVVEVTLALISIAALRLSGSFPSTIWTMQQY